MKRLGATGGRGRSSRHRDGVLTAIAASLALVLATATGADARQQASIVIDTQTNQALQSANADTLIYPASLTKMMTVYLLFDAMARGELRLATQLPVSSRAAAREPSRLGLNAGGTIAVRDAIPALIIKSANDVATVVAEALGGTESEFAAIMTDRARQLGMTRTTFRNASGLHDASQQTTARDMARLGRALIDHFPQYYGYFSDEEFTYGGRTYTTHNDLVTDYQGADGIKTGYVRASGFNVVTSARQNGHHLIAVVIGGETARARDRQMRRLLDAGFAEAAQDARGGTAVLHRVALTDLPGGGQANRMIVARHMRPDPRPGETATAPEPAITAPDPVIATWSALVASRPAPPATDRATIVQARRRALIAELTAAADARRTTAGAPAPQPLAALPPPRIIGEERFSTADASSADPAPGPAEIAATSVNAQLASGASALPDIFRNARRGPAGRNWGIQVGAFGSAATARQYAVDMASDLPVPVAPEARVQQIAVNGQNLFRARLFGFSEPEAQQSCGHLQDMGKSCMLVTPNGVNRNATHAFN